MRRLTTVLFGVLLWIGVASGAHALSVDPNPVNFSGWHTTGSTDISITGTTLTFQTSITSGKIARQSILVEDSGGTTRAPAAYGAIAGPGVNIKRIRVKGDGSVEFAFKSSFFHQHIHSGQTSDEYFVSYGDLAAGDVITLTGYRWQIFGSFGSEQATIVPEPSTALLVVLGLGGLAIAGRRRV